MKIAILILLHEFTEQQKMLIQHLSSDFDVFVHVDKRSNINVADIECISENVFVYKKYKVYWGHYNQILATLFLFKVASDRKIYKRFCFISGSDLPIKSNRDIQHFFEQTNQEYFEFDELPRKLWHDNGGFDRIDYFHYKSLSRGKTNKLSFICAEVLNKFNYKFILPCLKLLKLKRSRLNLKFYGGANWMDLTDNCVSQMLEIIEENPGILKRFKFTRGADEIFFQTVICNFVKNVDLKNRCLRFVDWKNCAKSPRVLTIDDFDRLISNNSIFSRKFNIQIDSEIVYKIYKSIDS